MSFLSTAETPSSDIRSTSLHGVAFEFPERGVCYHSAVDYDYAAGMEGADSHCVVGCGNTKAIGCGSTN